MTVTVTLLLALCGCQRTEPVEETRARSLSVFAAASLREVFQALALPFERAHPYVTLTFNFAGTQELRTQLEHGAAADVLASADQRHVDDLVGAGRVVAPVVFARNELVLVVARERGPDIQALRDLDKARRIVLGAPEVPIGRYARQVLDRAARALGDDFRARVEARVVSYELNVRQVLAKVALGEADAGIVYRTDGRWAGDRVHVRSIPAELNVVAVYPVALVVGASEPRLGRAWIEHLRSPEGRRTLGEAGFLPPGDEPSHDAAQAPR